MTADGSDTAQRLFLGEDLDVPVSVSMPIGDVLLFSTRSPEKANGKRNEDSCALFTPFEQVAVLAVADGCGGMPRGGDAADLAMQCLASTLASVGEPDELRPAILNAFEQTDAAINELGVGAATTLVVAEIQGDVVRTYHVGDSGLLLVGNRGKLRFQTISHSPVGYAIESGMLDEHGAMTHEDRNLVSNLLGFGEMHIDVGPRVRMQARDTLVLGSDGLFDNLRQAELIEHVRKGRLAAVARDLQGTCLERMGDHDGTPSKPDDLTFAVFRRAAPARAAATT